MTDLAQIVALATPIATAIAGAAALIWRTQRADVAALAAKAVAVRVEALAAVGDVDALAKLAPIVIAVVSGSKP